MRPFLVPCFTLNTKHCCICSLSQNWYSYIFSGKPKTCEIARFYAGEGHIVGHVPVCDKKGEYEAKQCTQETGSKRFYHQHILQRI